jgi:hypothetical protein
MPFSPRTNYGDRRATADDDSAPGAYAAHRLTSLPVIEGWGRVTKIDQIGRPWAQATVITASSCASVITALRPYHAATPSVLSAVTAPEPLDCF